MDLKQGPNSPHIHTGFPGVAGKYVYCPTKIFFYLPTSGHAERDDLERVYRVYILRDGKTEMGGRKKEMNDIS